MTARIRVWDLGVRTFHWLLVAALTASAFTGFILGKTWLTWHLIAGVVAVAAVFWRLVWGGLGTSYARFSSFLFPPSAVLAHLRDGHRHRHLGHNPLGALMVFSMLAVVLLLGLTGAVTLGGMLKQGPLRAFLSYAAGASALDLHHAVAVVLLVMAAAHLGGVGFESWRGHENLVSAMITGDKPALPTAHPVRQRRPHAGAAATVALVLLATGSVATMALAALPGRGVPPAALDPMFEEQCGACHLPYVPSLAPAVTWNAILADLKHHFDYDASLAPDQIAHLAAWLDANAAEHWDTLPSHILRQPAADGSHRITHSPGWQRIHRHISDAQFATAPVYHRADCVACHADAAAGTFAPQAIAIPAAPVKR